jgi:hypothetical protein
MIWMIFVALFAADNAEFLEMVEQRQAQGHDWHWVGRTVVTDDYIAVPTVEQDETKVFYWEIKE